MSEIKVALQPAHPISEQAASDDAPADFKLLTELELMLAGGGDYVEPWPK